MPDLPLISVITAVYNCERFLPEAIASVLAQSYPNWEYWLVNDGSADKTTAIARAAAHANPGRIHYLEHPGACNLGACSSRNLALAHARGQYIATLDADDVWLPNKLAEQVELAQRFPQAGLIYGASEYWRDWGDGPGPQKNEFPPVAPGDRLYSSPELLKISYPLGPHGAPCPSSLMIKADVLRAIRGFEEEFNRHQAFEDQALLSKLYLVTPAYVAKRRWDRYRIHPDSCCAIAERTGTLETARHLYFDWLRDYLVAQHVADEAVWRAWKRQTFRYRHPVGHFLQRATRRIQRTLRPQR